MLIYEDNFFWSDNDYELFSHEDAYVYEKMQKGFVGVSVLYECNETLEAYELIAIAMQWAISKGYDTPQPIDIIPYHDAEYEGDEERYVVTVGGIIERPEHLSLIEAINAAENELITHQGYNQEEAANIIRKLIKELGIIDITESEEENRYILLIDGMDDRGEGINLSTAIEAAIFELTDYKGYSLDDAEKIVYRIALPFINKF